VGVSVNKTRENSFTAQIKFARSHTAVTENLVIAPDRNKSSGADGYRLSERLDGIYRTDDPIVENEIGRLAA
jgi:hypothetical protein